MIYLDNAATMPMHPQVIDTVTDAMRNIPGNPSSPHAAGKQAKELLEASRKTIADAIGASPDEVFFTSGGTESNNLAITGAALAYERAHGKGLAITTALEHPSVTKTIRGLRRTGWDTEHLSLVGGDLDTSRLQHLLSARNDVALVSVAAVQSELGYRLPIHQVSRLVKTSKETGFHPLLHVDAVQAFGKMPLNVSELEVDLMSFCAHKIGGPKGIGALYVRKGTHLFTTAFGGGQEGGLRSGTQAVPIIAGFAEAVRIWERQGTAPFENARKLSGYLASKLRAAYPNVIVNSREDGSPFIFSFTLPESRNIEVLKRLSDKDIYLSASTACSSNHLTVPPGTWRDKHPLPLQLAGLPTSATHSTYRISFSDRTTQADIDCFLQEFQQAVQETRHA